MNDVCFIIPVYNEAAVIAKVIEQLTTDFNWVICINDGSTDNSAGEIRKTRALLINHPTNLGQGAALQTGIDFALQNPAIKYFVTFDADGQHQLDDARSMLDYLKHNPVDIVLGSRFKGHAVKLGKVRRLILKLAVYYSNQTTGMKLTDAHNGLRVFNRRVAESLHISQPGMAHASEIIAKISRHGYRYAELPNTITYSAYTKRKGQPLINAINILYDLISQKVLER